MPRTTISHDQAAEMAKEARPGHKDGDGEHQEDRGCPCRNIVGADRECRVHTVRSNRLNAQE